jgi:hypothetical protein
MLPRFRAPIISTRLTRPLSWQARTTSNTSSAHGGCTKQRVRLRPLIAAAIIVIVAASASSAQNAPSSPRDCDLTKRRFDDPFADHAGWWMPRYQWHAFYAVASVAAAEGIHRVTHMPRWASAVTATVALGIIPHIRGGLVTKRYPIDPLDWGFDAFNRSAPLFVWGGDRGGTWQSKTLAATSYVAGYAALVCYASP